ncbi:hypothetical protein PL321_13190 [Caloramator sp. mosi_1]|uniref:hypothetical protein n=1 Tax=Caloramator sp. mosi_1 TaxID=3023090 RepID=UPI00235DD8F0|nr:hypothetical protein [Caloramator sp. mosi_1]WDC83598.1 hypothetical protein PL321_13190 [Caloramator sp. mosi_1]
MGLAKLSGTWKTTSTKVPRRITEGRSTGQLNPNDIKGSYTFRDVIRNFDIPAEDIAYAFLIDVDQIDSFKCKDVESNFSDTQGKDIGTGAVRAFVAFYKGIEINLFEEAYLPKQAVEIILKNGNPTEKQIKYLNSHSVEVKK